MIPWNPLTASTFTLEEFSGITIIASFRHIWAIKAKAAPWFPDELVQTFTELVFITALQAPRALKAPAYVDQREYFLIVFSLKM
jgi:hypothetical protein